MGAAVATCLVECGHPVGWLRKGRSGATLQRAKQAGLTAFDDLGHLLANTDIVFSICPPHAALGVAQQLAGFRGIVVDANAISPMTSTLIGRTIAHGGARYVDGGIIGPPPVTAGTTRIYLAGDDGKVAGVFAGSALEAIGLAGAPPAASALKMMYAAWTKTTARCSSRSGTQPPPSALTMTSRRNGRLASPFSRRLGNGHNSRASRRAGGGATSSRRSVELSPPQVNQKASARQPARSSLHRLMKSHA